MESDELESMCRKAYISYYLQSQRIVGELLSKNHNGRPDLKMIKQVIRAIRTIFKEPEVNKENVGLEQVVN